MRTAVQAVFFCTLLAGFPCTVTGQVTYQLIAVTGDQAPGTGDTFRTFANPVINAAGDVAFQANLSGPTTDVVPHGIFAGSRASLRPLAIAGQEAPGADGARFRSVGWPNILTGHAQTLFYAQLVHDSAVSFDNDYGIWAGDHEDVRLFARTPGPAPGSPPGANYQLFFANPHSAGRLGCSARLQGPGIDPSNDSAAWVGTFSADSLQLVARDGDGAPDLPSGSRFSSLGTPVVNAAGQVALSASAEIPAAHAPGIWAGAADDLHLVAVRQGTAPGTLSRKFDFFSEPRLNNAGRLAFLGFLTSDNDEERLSDVGIWAGPATAAGIRPIILEGQQAPGFEPGVIFRGSAPGEAITYDAFNGNPVLGGGGHVAFAATVYGDFITFDQNDGVWVSEPVDASAPALNVIAREGDHPPGTPAGTLFAGILFDEDLIPAFERPSLNSTGQVAFEALTTGPEGESERGIWATDASGNLHLIAHSGQTIQVGPSDEREIAFVKFHAGGSSEDGHQSAFNDAGQIAFAVSFTDGSEALFVSNAVAHLPGDFNNDGRVDAADYVLWRKNDGTQAGYDKWRGNFGASLGPQSGSASGFAQPAFATVPEPSTIALLLLAVCWLPLSLPQFLKSRRGGRKFR